MNISKLMKPISIFLLTLTGLIVMADALSYQQTSCEYAPDDRYIWIKLSNGIQEKGISFVSDGVIFESSVIGMTYAKDYADITKVTHGQGRDGWGLLSVGFSEDGKLEQEGVGRIHESCWESLKALLAANPESQHIKVVD